jgi:hypothetical protein
MKICGGNGGTAPCILNIGSITDGGKAKINKLLLHFRERMSYMNFSRKRFVSDEMAMKLLSSKFLQFSPADRNLTIAPHSPIITP